MKEPNRALYGLVSDVSYVALSRVGLEQNSTVFGAEHDVREDSESGFSVLDLCGAPCLAPLRVLASDAKPVGLGYDSLWSFGA